MTIFISAPSPLSPSCLFWTLVFALDPQCARSTWPRGEWLLFLLGQLVPSVQPSSALLRFSFSSSPVAPPPSYYIIYSCWTFRQPEFPNPILYVLLVSIVSPFLPLDSSFSSRFPTKCFSLTHFVLFESPCLFLSPPPSALWHSYFLSHYEHSISVTGGVFGLINLMNFFPFKYHISSDSIPFSSRAISSP